jgi:hypothetical protein
MEDNDPEPLAQPGELEAAMRTSGYYQAVPAAAAAAAGGGREGMRSRINHDDLAAVMFASEVDPDDDAAWDVITEKARKIQDAIKSFGLYVTIPENIPAYAEGEQCDVILPTSVSQSGLVQKEESVEAAASDAAGAIRATVTSFQVASRAIYKTAVMKYNLIHYRKKFCAQEEIKKEKRKANAKLHLSMTALLMEKNPMYKERLFGQAEKRQKIVAPSRGIIDRFAKKANK